MTHGYARNLVRRGHAVTLFTGGITGAPVEETIDGVTVVRRGGPVTTRIHAPRWYREQRRKGRDFDVVVEEINTLPYFARTFASVPTVLWVHQIAQDVWWYEAPKPLAALGYGLEQAYLRSLRRSPAVVPSNSTRDDLLRFGFRDDRVLVVPNAIEHIDAPPVDKEPGLLAYLGRITPSKRIDHLIRALALVREQGLDARLVAAGPAVEDERRRLLALARDLGIADCFVLRGHLDEDAKRRLLASASLFLMASVREGWGLVVTEANALGVPAVVYDRPGLRDSTIHERTGLVTDPSPEALAAAIKRALTNSRLYERLSIGATAWAAEFTWRRSNDLFERALQAVAERGPLPAAEGPTQCGR
jgi:glycosyltransferase involved in cell wall biosynthesis